MVPSRADTCPPRPHNFVADWHICSAESTCFHPQSLAASSPSPMCLANLRANADRFLARSMASPAIGALESDYDLSKVSHLSRIFLSSHFTTDTSLQTCGGLRVSLA